LFLLGFFVQFSFFNDFPAIFLKKLNHFSTSLKLEHFLLLHSFRIWTFFLNLFKKKISFQIFQIWIWIYFVFSF
jgi:hypothetical protein